MKTFRSIIAVFAFAAIFAVSAFAQAAATPKIGIVNTGAFDTKEGITKYVNAMNNLEGVMKAEQTALQTMANRLQALQTEIEGYKKQLEDPKLPQAVDKTKFKRRRRPNLKNIKSSVWNSSINKKIIKPASNEKKRRLCRRFVSTSATLCRNSLRKTVI